MFSKELESLIQATLEDGILEDNEKAALVKRAQAEGVDLAELEIYINSIMQKRQKELEAKREGQIKEERQIDYQLVNQLLEEKRTQSLNYIDKMLVEVGKNERK